MKTSEHSTYIAPLTKALDYYVNLGAVASEATPGAKALPLPPPPNELVPRLQINNEVAVRTIQLWARTHRRTLETFARLSASINEEWPKMTLDDVEDIRRTLERTRDALLSARAFSPVAA